MSLRSKVIAFFALLLFIILCKWLFFNSFESTVLQEEMKTRGSVLVRMLAQLNCEPLLSSQINRLEQQLDAALNEKDVLYSRVYNNMLKVIAATNRQEEQWTYSGKIKTNTEISFYRDIMIASAPIILEDQVQGQVEIAFSLTALQDKLNQSKLLFFIIFCIEFILAIGFAVFLELQVVWPLSLLSRQIKQITPGDREVPLKRVKRAAMEIEELRSSIDNLRNKLKTARGEIITRTQLATLGHIATNMAHEIRNPLEAISGAVEILSSDMHLHKINKKSLSIIKEEITNLDDFLMEFLEFTRIKPTYIVETEVNPVIEDCLLLLQPLFRKKTIMIDFIPGKNLPFWHIDIRQIKRVLINLLLNSIDAIVKDGKILILSRLYEKNIEIEIQDNGIGITRENLEKIFDPYFTTKKTGFGMGLALSKKIIQQHGGTIIINSCSGNGTTIMVTIPFIKRG